MPPNEGEQVGQYIEEEAQVQQYSEDEEVLKLEVLRIHRVKIDSIFILTF